MNTRKSYSKKELLSYSNQFAIIVYDGQCIMCNRFIQFLIKKDKKKYFKFIAYQAIEDYEKQSFSESVELIHDGQHTDKSTAVLLCYQNLPAPYSWIAIFKIIPKSIRDYIYNLLAKNRYRILGKSEKCIIPDENIMSRFL